MLNSKSFLCLDFGAGSLKAAEFEPNEMGSLLLKQYGVKSLGLEGSQDTTREATLVSAIKEMVAEKGFGSKRINVCAPGFHVFSKFVKLPPVDEGKVTQIIQYEAQQNVPFPLEEVVWDYQILGAAASGELEVLLVAIKVDIVEGLFRTSDSAGLDLRLVDVSPAALCNAFRFNYGDLEGCTMLLDVGAKTSNLLFFEKGKVFSRSIPIGGNAITQDFAGESKLAFPAAEKLKVEEGFVSLGGAYEEPDNPQQAAISKIARQVMTRLHIQMNQTIQFYRGQQGGSAPQRLFLAGGASLMPYTAQFFAEKLSIPVEYFNPFRNIQIAPEVSLEELSKVAHSLGEVVGLGIRNLAQCPVDLNLMPKSYRSRQELKQKQPYFVATVFSMVLVVGAVGWFYDWVAQKKKVALEKLESGRLEEFRRDEPVFRAAWDKYRAGFGSANEYNNILAGRYVWIDLIGGVKQILSKVELTQAKDDAGIWIETFTPSVPPPTAVAAVPQPVAPPVEGGDPAAPVVAQPTGRFTYYVVLTCRAMNLTRLAPDANTKLMFAVEQEFKTNALFVPAGTMLGERAEAVAPEAQTFTFNMTLQLKNPIKQN
jgi:type IV pilus assembly protein PilM